LRPEARETFMARVAGADRFALDLKARLRLKFNSAERPIEPW
jgi:hypothetical protein